MYNAVTNTDKWMASAVSIWPWCKNLCLKRKEDQSASKASHRKLVNAFFCDNNSAYSFCFCFGI
jgi:hypothetical protein